MLLWAASAAVCAGLFLAFYGVVQTAGAGRVRTVDLLIDPVEELAEYDEFRARLNDSFATRVVDALGGCPSRWCAGSRRRSGMTSWRTGCASPASR